MDPNGAAANAPAQAGEGVEQLQRRCAELTAERDQLRQELADIKRNYVAVQRSLVKLMGVKPEFDEEELLAQSGKVQSLGELIEELEAQYGDKEAS